MQLFDCGIHIYSEAAQAAQLTRLLILVHVQISCFLTVIITIAYKTKLKDRQNVNQQSVYDITEKVRTSTGFEPLTMRYRCDTLTS